MSASFIFIPDISGFTKFVNSTEIEHSQHIISELLEIIIDNNQLGLEVCEIEGDAVLFYKENDVPSLKQIYDQCELIFTKFHYHLKRYEVERICQCGACSTASTLSIKFIAHYGEVGFTRVKSSLKPFGPNVVIAHRLLKNNIDHNEYILVSKEVTEQDQNPDEALKFVESSMEYPDSGNVSFSYMLIDSFHDLVPDPEPPKPLEKIPNPITQSVLIEKPLFFVFEIVSNLDLRLLWNTSINKLEYEVGKMNRVGTKHRCLFNSGFADFETITDDFGEENLVYGEKLNKVPGMEYVALYYLMSQVDESTRLTVQAHYKKKNIIGTLITPFLRLNMKNSLKKSTKALKEVCEKNDDIPYLSTTYLNDL